MSSPTVMMPEIQVLSAEDDEDDENPEVKAWRTRCLQDLSAAKRKRSLSKWATVARAFAPPCEHKVSMDVEIVEATPPLCQQEMMSLSGGCPSSSASLKMKSNVDSFANVVDLEPREHLDDEDRDGSQQLTGRNHWSQFTRDSLCDNTSGSMLTHLGDGLRRASSAVPLSSTKKKGHGVHLNDKLSRRKMVVAGGPGGSSAGGSSSIWKYANDASPRAQAFLPESSVFNATALPSTIHLSSGVVLSQGESVLEGPARVEGANTMSRKRFDVRFAWWLLICWLLAKLARAALWGFLSRSWCVASPECSDRPAAALERAREDGSNAELEREFPVVVSSPPAWRLFQTVRGSASRTNSSAIPVANPYVGSCDPTDGKGGDACMHITPRLEARLVSIVLKLTTATCLYPNYPPASCTIPVSTSTARSVAHHHQKQDVTLRVCVQHTTTATSKPLGSSAADAV